jgi:two-component system nitrogen regulation sensor histidine kinase GlnL
MSGKVMSLPRRALPPDAPPPDANAMLGALLVPVVLLDAADRFRFVNQAAEQFLGMSRAQLRSLHLADLLPTDNPVFMMLRQVRAHDAVVVDHELTLESPRLSKHGITVQAAPMPDEPGCVLLTFQDAAAPPARSAAWRRSWRMRSRTRCRGSAARRN